MAPPTELMTPENSAGGNETLCRWVTIIDFVMEENDWRLADPKWRKVSSDRISLKRSVRNPSSSLFACHGARFGRGRAS